MKELGNILKEKRKAQGLDLDRVHRATKIQEKYLEAIEDGNMDVFFAEIYYKSFVKSYSKFLGLNGEDLLSQYEKRKGEAIGDGIGDESSGRNEKNPRKTQKTPQEKSSDLKKLFVTVLIAGILCAVFLYLNKNISIFFDDNTDKLSVSEQKKIMMRQMHELQQQKEAELKEQRLKEITEAEQKAKVEERQKSLKPFPQTQSANAPAQAAAQGPNKTLNRPLPAVTQQTQKEDKQELVIDAVENVWIRVEGDGREIFQGTVVRGTKKTWKANDEFVVKIGYTPGVNVYFNGAAVDVVKGAVQDVNTLVLKRQQ